MAVGGDQDVVFDADTDAAQGLGRTFRGVYDRHRKKMALWDADGSHGQDAIEATDVEPDDPRLGKMIGRWPWYLAVRRQRNEETQLSMLGTIGSKKSAFCEIGNRYF